MELLASARDLPIVGEGGEENKSNDSPNLHISIITRRAKQMLTPSIRPANGVDVVFVAVDRERRSFTFDVVD